MSKLKAPVPPATKSSGARRAPRKTSGAELEPRPNWYSPSTARLVPDVSAQQCHLLATEVHNIIRSFHSSVASPLATIGLELELIRLAPETDKAVCAELVRITGNLDEIITVIRDANRKLREVEKRILLHGEPQQSDGG